MYTFVDGNKSMTLEGYSKSDAFTIADRLIKHDSSGYWKCNTDDTSRYVWKGISWTVIPMNERRQTNE